MGRISVGGDENVLKMDCVDSCNNNVNVLNVTKVHLKIEWLILYYVYFITMIKKKIIKVNRETYRGKS